MRCIRHGEFVERSLGPKGEAEKGEAIEQMISRSSSIMGNSTKSRGDETIEQTISIRLIYYGKSTKSRSESSAREETRPLCNVLTR
jgi:hypothetical protein